MTEKEHDPLAEAGAESATDDTEVAPADEPEVDDEAADDVDAADEDADQDDEDAFDEDEEAEPEAATAAHRGRDRHPAKAAPAAPSVSEIAVHVSDRGSAVFVLAVVGVFVAILLYGMLLGHNGLISGMFPTPSPAPTPIATPVATDSPAPTDSPAASGSAAPSAPSSAAPSPSAS